ncbi:MAG: hypothetical protein GVY26_09395 [Bacteroidetes bacterium]|jgi:hypothetical protein|nr:hypothetical protein [Bacteroidota bacterium]
MRHLLFFFLLALSISACNGTEAEQDDEVSALREFAQFYERFHQDTAFQMERVLFPLPGLPREADSSLIASGRFRWTKDNWRMQQPINFEESQFEQQLVRVSKDLIIEKIVNKEYGLKIERRFSRLEDGWHLIYYSALNKME